MGSIDIFKVRIFSSNNGCISYEVGNCRYNIKYYLETGYIKIYVVLIYLNTYNRKTYYSSKDKIPKKHITIIKSLINFYKDHILIPLLLENSEYTFKDTFEDFKD